MATVSKNCNSLPLIRCSPPPDMDCRETPPVEKKHFFMVSGVSFELDTKYAPVQILRNGSYGLVCCCVNRETNELVAVKKISDALGDLSTALRTLREIQILRQVRHQNVISIKDVMVSSSPAGRSNFKHAYLVQDLMDADLAGVMESNPKLSADACMLFLFQILTWLHHLHSANVIHGDLKPQNILLKSNLEVKIGNFGIARTIHQDSQFRMENMSTWWYQAPKSTKVDMWSVGCIFAQMLRGGKILFRGGDPLSQIKIIHSVLGTHPISDLGFIPSEIVQRFLKSLPFSSGFSFSGLFASEDPMGVDLLRKMVLVNLEKRISALHALRHRQPTLRWSVKLAVDKNLAVVDDKTMRALIWDEMLLSQSRKNANLITTLS